MKCNTCICLFKFMSCGSHSQANGDGKNSYRKYFGDSHQFAMLMSQ